MLGTAADRRFLLALLIAAIIAAPRDAHSFRAPQARDAAPDHRPAAASLPAAPVSPSPAEPPASFLDTARKAIEGGQ